MKPKLLILDDYEGQISRAPAMARLRELADVTILARPLVPRDKLHLKECQVLLALRERTKLDADFFNACDNLALVLQTGGHAYHIDLKAATKRGVIVALGRHVTRPMVVIPELVFAFILGLTRNIYTLTTQMSRGAWSPLMGESLAGRTLGILGYGRHGKPIARLAKAFGMKVVAWERGTTYVSDELGTKRLPLDELLACSDIVSIHLRLSPQSHGLLNRERIAKMKPGALLINTSRGAIVDEAALVDALIEKRLGGVGLDVFAVEPLPRSSPLRTLPNVLLTPHIGWQVSDVVHEFVSIAVDQLAQWQQGKLRSQDIINPPTANVPLQGLKRSTAHDVTVGTFFKPAQTSRAVEATLSAQPKLLSKL
jgi:phosphoglycerate dehydrogenase-like enzyme